MRHESFRRMLGAQADKGKFLCIGLDPDIEKIPPHLKRGSDVMGPTLSFLIRIVDATRDVAAAYKPNSAFFEGQGQNGWYVLEEICRYIRRVAPDCPIIYDGKRGDIGNTNRGYTDAAFHRLEADAITLQPYMGRESLKPFLDMGQCGSLILCRTSNPGSDEFQNLELADGRRMYQVVAHNVAHHWNERGNCGLVVGATFPEELRNVREIVGDLLILIPGVGAQGGDLEKSVKWGRDSKGRGFLINSSRAILYASEGEDFADAAAARALADHRDIVRFLNDPAPPA